jgi:hypothetical protein
MALHAYKTPAHTLPSVELQWTKVHVDMYVHDTSFQVILSQIMTTSLQKLQDESIHFFWLFVGVHNNNIQLL